MKNSSEMDDLGTEVSSENSSSDLSIHDGPKAEINIEKDSKESKNDPKSIAQLRHESMDYLQKHYLDVLLYKERRRRLAIEFVFYILFSIILVIFITKIKNTSQEWQLQSAASDALVNEEFPGVEVFKDFYSIGSSDEIWQWAQGPLVNALQTSEDNPYIYGSIEQIGALRIRSMRVKPGMGCRVESRYKGLYSEPNSDKISPCYPKYELPIRNRDPYGPDDEWTFSPAYKTKLPAIWGYLTGTYDGSGYIVDVPKSSPDSANIIAELADNNFVDRATRAIFFHVNLFNPNVQNALEVMAFVEIGAGGYMMPRVKFRFFKLELWSLPVLISGIILLAFLIGFTFMIVYDIKIGGPGEFFSEAFNVLELFNIAVFWAIVLKLLIYSYKLVKVTQEENLSSLDYVHLSVLAADYTSLMDLLSFNVFMTLLKMFRYLKSIRRLNAMWDTLSYASLDLITFFAFFFIIFIAFTIMGNTLFGPELDSFRDLTASMLTIFRMAIGEIDFDEMRGVNRVLGPLFIISFVFFIVLVLMNMFLAIIDYAYDQTAERARKGDINTGIKQGALKFITAAGGLLKRVKSISPANGILKRKKSGVEEPKEAGDEENPAIEEENKGNLNEVEDAEAEKKRLEKVLLKNRKKIAVANYDEFKRIMGSTNAAIGMLDIASGTDKLRMGIAGKLGQLRMKSAPIIEKDEGNKKENETSSSASSSVSSESSSNDEKKVKKRPGSKKVERKLGEILKALEKAEEISESE